MTISRDHANSAYSVDGGLTGWTMSPASGPLMIVNSASMMSAIGAGYHNRRITNVI